MLAELVSSSSTKSVIYTYSLLVIQVVKDYIKAIILSVNHTCQFWAHPGWRSFTEVYIVVEGLEISDINGWSNGQVKYMERGNWFLLDQLIKLEKTGKCYTCIDLFWNYFYRTISVSAY